MSQLVELTEKLKEAIDERAVMGASKRNTNTFKLQKHSGST